MCLSRLFRPSRVAIHTNINLGTREICIHTRDLIGDSGDTTPYLPRDSCVALLIEMSYTRAQIVGINFYSREGVGETHGGEKDRDRETSPKRARELLRILKTEHMQRAK